ncbi:hypothetical protein L4174_023810 (plasmid) [Photobacterium sp. CCB-ST2H9]|uniref:hypothetical protein n=1 Tax=Photobacterium sp. CCB-ST2H9 TaxID=2912855 RepID=UPI002005DF2F|nr:hypothetical protein [Photobacterium sp. CCB-ST2H9]UTM60413.1 hypothetical protein L4174_023810 [Photobacterium sp. CCB-ST2H9]
MTTPNELLENVKARFNPLMHDEKSALNALLRQALQTYQDLAGVVKVAKYTKPSQTLTPPAGFLFRIVIKDSRGQFVLSNVFDGEIELTLYGGELWPLTLTYGENLVDTDYETYKLPPTAEGLISDYLQALIAIPNTERIRRISTAGKIDVSDLPTQSELMDRKIGLEETIKSSRSMASTFSIMG